MSLNRREFLAGAGWTMVAGATAGCRTLTPATAAGVPVSAASFADWAAVRAQFALDPEWRHLSQFYIVSHPRPVRDAIERHRRQLDANPFLVTEHGLFEDTPSMPDRSRQAAAEYLGARADEIALTDSTTMGLALVYQGLPLRAGQEVLCTTHDHYVHHESIRLACERSGASVRRVALYRDPARTSVDEVVGNLRQALRRETRVVGLTWVHSSTGVKLPIRALADVVAEANRRRSAKNRILLVVDGVHGFGNQDESPVDMGCDFFAAGTHKWIFAPRGTGIVWARAENWARLRPTIPTFADLGAYEAWMNQTPAPTTTAAMVTPGGFKAYEHQWAMVEAFRFQQQIGRKRVADRTAMLNDQCKAGLAQMDHVTLHTPRARELSAGIVCFEVKGVQPADVARRLLAHRVIASTSPYKVTYARLAPSVVNDESDVDAALRAVAALKG